MKRALAVCTALALVSGGAACSGDDGSVAATTEGPGTSDASTGDASVSTTSTATATTTGVATTTTTGTASTTAGDTEGGACAPACAEYRTLEGPQYVFNSTSPEEFECVERIAGDLFIQQLKSAAPLAGLRHLREVEGTLNINNNELPDLTGLDCLETAQHGLLIEFNRETFVAVSGLASLTSVGNLRIQNNMGPLDLAGLAGLTVAESAVTVQGNDEIVSVAPLAGVQATGFLAILGNPMLTELGPLQMTLDENSSLNINNNASLTDLDDLANLPGAAGLDIVVSGNESLVSVSGLANVIATSETPSIQLSELPSLASLEGLEGYTAGGDLWLSQLPLVSTLAPVSGLTVAINVNLSDLPQLPDLYGLHNLEDASDVAIGECLPVMPGSEGLAQITSLAGLGSLTHVDALTLGENDSLVSLAGLDSIESMGELIVRGNDVLTDQAINTFLAQFQEPPLVVDCEVDQCVCGDILPW